MKTRMIAASVGTLALVVVAGGFGLARLRPDLLPGGARPAAAHAHEHADAGSGLYCKEHGVPEAFCTLCHEELAATLLLCPEHGNIPEDICTLCHPEVEAKHKIQMCPKGHGLPEHFCVECGKAPQAAAHLPDDGWCADHGKPESACPECPAAIAEAAPAADTPRACRRPLPTVRLASARLAGQVGIKTAEASEEQHTHRLVANAETAYDANRYAEVTPRVAGFLASVDADLGRFVRRGDRLAVVDSGEVGAARARLVAARAALELAEVTYDRTQGLARSEAIPARRELEDLTARNRARAEVLDAEQRLRNLGLGDEAIARIDGSGGASGRIDILAPIDGVVVLRHAVQGEAVEPTTQLFAVVDTSNLWLWIDVYEADLASVSLGQEVDFLLPGNGSAAHSGRITWVGTEVDPTTRTLRVRAELANADGKLRARQFGRAEIRVGDEHRAILIPKRAVQTKDGVDLVFLPEEGSRYRPQRVLIRPDDRPDVVEVAWGLKAGQRVVTDGAFLLKTEIMKGAIGAGCCE